MNYSLSNVATLNIAINANTGGVARGLDETARRIGSFSRVGQAAGAGLRSMAVQAAGAAAAFLSLRAIVDRFLSSAQRLDDVRKQAIRLGTTTEVLSGLQYAANLAGVEAGQLQAAMERAADGIATAAAQGGSAAEVFSRLGLDVAQQAQLSPDQQFLRIAAAIQQIGNQGERIRAVRDIFGRAGTDLLPLFADGAQNLRELTAEAQRFGDAVSGPAAAAAENMNDAFTRAQANVSRISEEITGAIAPAVQALVESFGLIDASTQSMRGSLELIADTIKVLGAITLATVVEPAKLIFKSVAGVIEGLIAAGTKIVAWVTGLFSEDAAAPLHAFADELARQAAASFEDAAGHLLLKDTRTFWNRTAQLQDEAQQKAAQLNAHANQPQPQPSADETARKVSERLATVGAFSQGTREAFSLSAEARRGQQAPIVDGLNRVVATGRDQVAELKRMNEELRHGQFRLLPANL